jgi:hypothetical protein
MRAHVHVRPRGAQIDGDTSYVNSAFEVPASSDVITTRDPSLAVTTAALQSDLVR